VGAHAWACARACGREYLTRVKILDLSVQLCARVCARLRARMDVSALASVRARVHGWGAYAWARARVLVGVIT
jgi:hypothetical protein